MNVHKKQGWYKGLSAPDTAVWDITYTGTKGQALCWRAHNTIVVSMLSTNSVLFTTES